MIRAFLVHLGRFFRMLLLSVFVCVLFVPLAYNILEIIFGRIARQDTIYLSCALISIVVSLIYTYWHKDRVNSDEVIFFMRNRMIKQRRKFNHFIALNAVLVAQVGNYDLKLHIKKYKEQLKTQKDSEKNSNNCKDQGFQGSNKEHFAPLMMDKLMKYRAIRGIDELDNQARCLAYSEALVFIESLMSSVGANDKQISEISKIYIAALLDKPDLEYECHYVKKISKKCGPYLSELLFVLLIRTLMNVNPFKIGYIDYRILLEHPTIKKIGAMLLDIDEKFINESYFNRYFFLLNQEQVRIRQKWIESQYQEQKSSHDANYNDHRQDSYSYQYSYSYSYQEGGYQENQSSQSYHDGFKGKSEDHKGADRFLSKIDEAYITLGLSKNSTIEQVKKQYRKLVFKYHPDHIADFESFSDSQKQELNAQFLAIVHAYELILKSQA